MLVAERRCQCHRRSSAASFGHGYQSKIYSIFFIEMPNSLISSIAETPSFENSIDVAPVSRVEGVDMQASKFQALLKESQYEEHGSSVNISESDNFSSYLVRMDKAFQELNEDRFRSVQDFPLLSMNEIAAKNIELAMRTAAVNINFQVTGQVSKSLRNSIQQLLKGQ